MIVVILLIVFFLLLPFIGAGESSKDFEEKYDG